MKQILTFFFLLFSVTFYNCFAQNINGKIVNKTTNEGIPYATIKIDKYSGVISNEEGVFSLNITNKNDKNISVSCMGFEPITLSIEALKKQNFTIVLVEAINTLQEVTLNNKPPNADSIIAKVNMNLKDNYDFNNKNHKIFHRESNITNFSKIGFEVEKAKHLGKKKISEINNNIESVVSNVRDTDFKQYTDFLGNIYINEENNTKLTVQKVTSLLDVDKNFDEDILQQKMQTSFLKSLDTTITYKLKTGIIKIDDSLSLKSSKEKSKVASNEYEVKNLKEGIDEIINQTSFKSESFLKNIINQDLYEYEYKGTTIYNNTDVYIINFEPKRSKSKFSGKLYISENDYAILRADYSYAKGKRGSKVNLKLLLGIKYIEDKCQGTILFNEDENGKYFPNYIKRTKGEYIYLSRDLKFIENTSNKYKTKLDITIELKNITKNEILFIDTQNINLSDYNTIVQKEKVPYITIEKYDPKLWDNEKTLEPLQEMKKFGTVE